MNRSDSIKELAGALCKAQAVIEGAAKDKMNPAFRSKYADLAACWDAARKPLADNGLAVVQAATSDESGVKVETMLMHSSGEWLSDSLGIPLTKRDAHGVGAAVTYGRRFGFCAMVGICPEDDDGNKAAGKAEPEAAKAPRGSARETLQEAFDTLSVGGQEAMRARAQTLDELYAAKGINDVVNELEGWKLDADDKMALWFLLDSTLRSNIKREQARRQKLTTGEREFTDAMDAAA